MTRARGRPPAASLALAVALSAALFATPAAHADTAAPSGESGAASRPPEPPASSPLPGGALATVVWILAQTIPSPEVAFGEGAATGGLRWEVTPLLYTFGLYRPRSRFQALRIEPAARHSGSVELVLTPEFLGGVASTSAGWMGRVGARLHLPLASRGETLSLSLGGSAYATGSGAGGSIEAGLCTLFGFAGLLTTFSPALHGGEWIETLSVRFF